MIRKPLEIYNIPKSLWLIPGAGHIEGLSKRPEAYEERIVSFFDRALLGEAQ